MSVTTLISVSVMGNFILWSPEYKFGTLIYPFHICCGVFSNKEMRVLEKGVCLRVIMTIIIIVLLDLRSVGLSSAVPNERDHPN